MALKGTLKDFGIADILQLIGQQQKTGALTVSRRGETIVVSFVEGNIVSAETTSRKTKDLIGSMLVAANLLTEEQLDFALETQKRTLQRLGDVLVGQSVITAQRFGEFVHLQTSETLFKLFAWKAGTYEFEQREIEVENMLTPLRAETILMEGFRRIDEWPEVRKRITSLQMTFEKIKPLPSLESLKHPLVNQVFETKRKKSAASEAPLVGDNERVAFDLIEPGRTVQRLVELSVLGEFETAKALNNLIEWGYVGGLAPTGKGGAEFETDARKSAAIGIVGRLAVSMAVIAAFTFIASRLDFGTMRLGRTGASTYTDPAVQRFTSQHQISRLASAIEVLRLEKGAAPQSLSELVEAQLVSADDLRFPWRDPYFYRRKDDGTYVLLPPLY